MINGAKDIVVIGHAAIILFATGFLIFFCMIYKKTRKVIRRGIKAKRRMRKAGF